MALSVQQRENQGEATKKPNSPFSVSTSTASRTMALLVQAGGRWGWGLVGSGPKEKKRGGGTDSKGNGAMTDGGSSLAMMMGVCGDDPPKGQRLKS